LIEVKKFLGKNEKQRTLFLQDKNQTQKPNPAVTIKKTQAAQPDATQTKVGESQL
jgi:hypothetical protein